MSITTTANPEDRAHGVPPDVTVEGAGHAGDIPLITLDLEPSGIARTMARQLAYAVAGTFRTHLLSVVARVSHDEAERRLDDILDVARGRAVYQIALTYDAAMELRERLDVALDVAESVCRGSGCVAVGVLDGLCPAHHEAADTRQVG